MTALEDIVENIYPTGNLSLILSTVWIIVNVYAKATTSSLSIGQLASNDKSYYYHNDLIEEILKRTNQHESGMNIKFFIGDGNTYEIDDNIKGTEPKSLLTEDEIFMNNFRNKDKGIWLIDSLESFIKLENTLVRIYNSFQRNGFFTVIYTGSEFDALVNIRRIFRRLFYIYVININVLILTKQRVEVYTYFPFKPNRCNSNIPELYLTFDGIIQNDSYTLNKLLFPDKLSNMYGCEMVVTTFNLPPFITLNYNNKTKKLDRVHGIEGMILTLISKKMNFTIRILEQPERDHGIVTSNGTITGAMKMIADGITNLTVASYMYNKMRADVMQAAFSYTSFSFMLVIPKGRQMSPYERLVKPFSNIIWICLGFSVLFAIFIIFGVKLFCKIKVLNFISGQKNRLPFTNLWSSLYGIGLHSLPRRNFARYLLTVWILYTLVLRNAYLSELFSILQDGRTRTSLQTINELVEKNFTVYTPKPIVGMLKDSIKSIKISVVDSYDRLKDSFYDRVQSETETIAFPVMAPYILYHNQNKSNYNYPLNVLPEKLFMVPVTMYLRKHSFFLYKINLILMGLMSSGFIRKFEDIYMDKKYWLQKESHLPKALSVWLLFGIFSLYLILLLLCIFVFFLELYSRRSSFFKSILDYFNI